MDLSYLITHIIGIHIFTLSVHVLFVCAFYVQLLKSRTYNKFATLPAILGSAVVHDYFFGSGPKVFLPATTLLYGALGSECRT